LMVWYSMFKMALLYSWQVTITRILLKQFLR